MVLDIQEILHIIKQMNVNGAVAQLGERLVRSEKAASSTLVCSTSK